MKNEVKTKALEAIMSKIKNYEHLKFVKFLMKPDYVSRNISNEP